MVSDQNSRCSLRTVLNQVASDPFIIITTIWTQPETDHTPDLEAVLLQIRPQ